MRILPPTAYFPTLTGLMHNALRREAVYPFYASFKITSRCHYGCAFCNVWKDKIPDLSTDDIKKILDNLSRSSVLMTSFEGGEPFLREDMGELLRYARDCGFYLLFTTSARRLLEYPLEEFAPLIDFFHVSIDEGHNNLEMFDHLHELTKLPTQVSVQVVVTRDTVEALENKVRSCYEAGANSVVIPAAAMDNAEDCFPDMVSLEKKLLDLHRKYPATIHTPRGYFKAYKSRRCSSASVIIAPDGRLYYPCHIRGTKGPDLRTHDLTQWLGGDEAASLRRSMKQCTRNCGWYQYYAIGSYTSARTALKALWPMLVQRKKA
ncbi:MAG: radical SAM protein [Chitinivibrionales bacterium]|nr:radical SAM protein [Chitinivibrionales bacterium]MBD3356824.1 radical SAM protein [Chitinivibrionales bacterium]